MDKKSLRKIALQKRAEMNVQDAPVKFAENFLNNVTLAESAIIALYTSSKNELDISYLGSILVDAGHSLCLPRIGKAPLEMHFHEYKIGDVLAENKFRILEPLETAKIVQPSIVVVPMLAYDASKNRLGYGGGYYDKTLQNSDVLKIGAAYAQQKIDKVPSEPHDVKMDIIVTDTLVYL